ncbi:MAG: C40 family peptidase [Brachybacterium sp.]|uniref:C40 family peptidase n=1 Tax=Brachybacterium sp. TaxID=1891286 RepID=UPI0026494D23|nr:C40 family peptidase [Brachybacterium sp.]MDN5685850.1 C40 family peptidase [Brachybacterium sp.]
MKKKLVAGALTVGCLAPLALAGGAGVIGIAMFADSGSNEALCAETSLSVQVNGKMPEGVAGTSAEAMKNAAIIMKVGEQEGIPARGQMVALMVAMQESTLQNLSAGDRDSIGLFQQRPSQGWGTPEQLHDPSYASLAFYRGIDSAGGGQIPGLMDIDGWESMPLTVAAQRVQRSAYPRAYAKHEQPAREIMSALSDVDVTVDENVAGAGLCENGSGAAGIETSGKTQQKVIEAARSTLGAPYVFGAGDWNGPQGGGQDCSGLTTYSYAEAGIRLPRVARGQWAALRSYEVKPSEIQPGDLIFESWGRLGSEVSHVTIYIGNGKAIEASRSAGRTKISDARLSGEQFVGIARVPENFGK